MRFVKEIPYNMRKVKWFYQRGKRGWADCDWWNMDDYLIGIILPMLRELKKNNHGYPGIDEADTPEKWDAILDQMILGFEAGKRVIDDEYFVGKVTEDGVKPWIEKVRADQEVFGNGMKLFSKWYWNLWD